MNKFKIALALMLAIAPACGKRARTKKNPVERGKYLVSLSGCNDYPTPSSTSRSFSEAFSYLTTKFFIAYSLVVSSRACVPTVRIRDETWGLIPQYRCEPANDSGRQNGDGGKLMAEVNLLNRMYHTIVEWFVEHGRAPDYVELAHRLELPAEETRRTLRELVDMGLPGVWQHPGTDYIESFAPFANLPTQYLITVRRRQRWYGQ